MKRRNVEIGKMRRTAKKNKIADGIFGSPTMYLKFIFVWLFVMFLDFLLEFRFELLWPFYLLLRSVYDSYKYQGLAFSIFFVCIALTSDMLCYFFIPVNWLLFLASTYVWVQFVWHSDKGVCMPTVTLWTAFVGVEYFILYKEINYMAAHVNLCRPFASHCIGYPVVTLGFGFKSYMGFRIRQKKQKNVAKENEFYMQLMLQALPAEDLSATPETVTNNGVVPALSVQNKKHSNDKNGHIPNGIANGIHNGHGKSHKKSVDKSKDKDQPTQYDNDIKHDRVSERHRAMHGHTNGCAVGSSADDSFQEVETRTTRRKEKKEQDKEREAAEYLQRLETDCKRLRNDLQSSRASEQELRLQVAALTTSEKVSKGELSAMQREVEELQQRLQSLQSSRSSEKQSLSTLERRLAEERRMRCNLESQLNQERKNRKQEEARAAQAAAQTSRECTESCKSRRRELESELTECRTQKHWAEERYKQLEMENMTLVEQLKDIEMLMSALAAMQEKNSHLENSLSAETRIKLDLFSALGEAKRQVEIRESANRAQEKEIDELKSKIAQVLAVMPNDAFGHPAPTTNISRVRLSDGLPGSTLDPNATAYTPKGSLVASTEA